jgi:hypothetical protein
MHFVWFSLLIAIISLNNINQLIVVMEKRCVFFAVRTEFLNIIYMSFGFRVLIVLTEVGDEHESNQAPYDYNCKTRQSRVRVVT